MKKVELIIFDMDGLMFDTEKISFISWKKAAHKYDYEIDEEIFKKTIGANLNRTIEIYLAHFGERFPIDAIRDERFKVAENLINLNGVPVKKGLYELLNYLKETDIKIAVATSTSRQRAMTLLKMVGIDMHFDYVLCGDEIEHSKPHPEIFLKVSERLCCLPENCIVLEDSEVGIIAANRAGMIPIMIPDMKEPEEEIKKLIYKQLDSLHDVKTILEDIYRQSQKEA
ncbi:MAG TPA: HAD family phosphatase [Clostridia bacterium]|nr:HAD family phosphatase [Clostridia bacterium]